MDSNMLGTIVAAAVTGGFTLIGTIITVYLSIQKNSKEMDKKLSVQQAIINTKIDELTREVREHNGFARRLPVVEKALDMCEHRLDVIESHTN